MLLLVFFTNALEVSALNTGFETKEMTEKEKETFFSNCSISSVKTPPTKGGIRCFDVNEDGLIAIGMGFGEKTVCVYTSQGEFLYGYTFEGGQSFGVEWDGEYINIYFVRSDVIISLDSEGNVLDAKIVKNAKDNNTHRSTLLHSTKRTVHDTTYLIRNDMGVFNWIALSYSQVVVVDVNGVERIIYDVNSTQLVKTIVLFVFVLAFLSFATAVLVKHSIIARRRFYDK